MISDDRTETITDRAEIRASDEPSERGDFPCCSPAPAMSATMLAENLHHSRAMSGAHFERAQQATARAEAAEAEVERLRNGREAKVEWLRAVHDDLVPNVARVIWDASRADEGTISATGANVVAKALLSDRDALCALVDTAEGEVAMLRRGARELGRTLDRTLMMALDASGRYDAIEEDGDGDWEVVWETLAGLRPRAEAAEAEVRSLRAKVAAVGARLDRLDKDVQSIASASEYGMGYQDGQSDERAYISREIRAALATGEGK